MHSMTDSESTKSPRGTRWCKTAIALATLGGICALVGLGGGATRVLGPMAAFGAFGIGLPLFIIAILSSLIGLALSKGTAGNASTVGTWAALLVGVIFISAGLSQQPDLEGVPSIHDISTNVSDPPLFVEVTALRGDGSNPAEYLDDGTAQQQLDAYPDIVTLQVAKPLNDVFAAANAVVSEFGWTPVSANASTGLIEATAITYWFGFQDDVVIRLRSSGGATLVDVRSKSRIGKGDMGANAARVRAFIKQLNAQTSS